MESISSTQRGWIARWICWSALAVAIGTALILVTIMFGPPLPDLAGDAAIGLYLGAAIGISQAHLVRRLGISGAAWAVAVAAAITVAAAVVQGPLEDTGWGLVPEGAAHAAVMGTLLGLAQLAVVRGRLRAGWWLSASLATALTGELIGRLVGLVSPAPTDLVVVFVLWQSLVGVVMIRLVGRSAVTTSSVSPNRVPAGRAS